MGKNKKLRNALANKEIFDDYYNRLINLALSAYEWHNLPETIDERFLELSLLVNGACVFFKDDVAGYLALQTMYGGNLDVYRIPNDRRAYAVNGYNKKLDSKNSVLIFNNYMRTNSLKTIEIFADKLYEIDRTIYVNVKAQKTPIAILCDEKQRLTMQNLFMQYDGNEPFIFGDKNLNLEGIKVINTQAPFVSDKLMILKKQIWNEAMTFFGIENSNTEKKERLVSDEITSNLGNVEMERYTKLNARRQACKLINTMFNLNISVDFRSNSTTINTSDSLSTAKEETPNV